MISKLLKKALDNDTYLSSIHEKHIDTMNDWADSGCEIWEYQVLVELYEMFIGDVKDRIDGMIKEKINKPKKGLTVKDYKNIKKKWANKLKGA